VETINPTWVCIPFCIIQIENCSDKLQTEYQQPQFLSMFSLSLFTAIGNAFSQNKDVDSIGERIDWFNFPAERRVSFKSTCNVVLIPTNEEYRKANCDLWHSQSLYKSNKELFTSQITEFMAHNPQLKSCSMKQIVSLLWDSIDYDPIDRIEQHGKVSQLIGLKRSISWNTIAEWSPRENVSQDRNQLPLRRSNSWSGRLE